VSFTLEMDIGIFDTFCSKSWSVKYRLKEKRKVSEPNFTKFGEKMVLTSKIKKETTVKNNFLRH